MADHEHFKLDPEEIEKLARIGATQVEMAAWFGCSLATIEKKLRKPAMRAVLERGLAAFDISLRRKQAQLAEAGNVTMLIWLGKQRLGQRDRFEHTGADGSPLIPISAIDAIIRGK